MRNHDDQSRRTWWTAWGKRAFDIVGALLLLLVLSPVLIVSALLIKLTSSGPIFFVQRRGGLNGAPFALVKFRTMRGGRVPDPKEIVPLEHPEITPVGRILRRSKIDELPQLWNVLRGEMSLVGPRPTLLDQIEKYDAIRRRRLLAKPGVTGLAQVYGSAMMPWDERIMYDVAYVRSCSPQIDAWVLLLTAWVVLIGEERAARRFTSTKYANTLNSDEIARLQPPDANLKPY
ncbi:MAG: sugar transferase [Planctomycetes bacterium]|nr:sugar transferase [Planctomycetota bacterium]